MEVAHMKIVIDTRETALINACSQKIPNYPHIHLVVTRLDIGDIEIYYNDTLVLVWERKTLQDLLSSLKDNRYEEQSMRLLSQYSPHNIVYIIEGIMNQVTAQERGLIYSTMTSLSFFKKVHIWRSVHSQDTADQLIICANKIYKQYNNGQTIEDPLVPHHSYSDTIKRVKKENVNPDNIGELMLCQIPGISNTTANAIMEKVEGDFSQLLKVLREEPDELSIILIGKTQRKIGKKVIGKMRDFLIKE